MNARVLIVVVLAGVTASAAQQAPPAPAAQGRGRSPYQEAGQLPARIMEFEAEPAAIKPGDSTTLTWAAENPRTTTIEPTIGRATPRGLMKVTPKATTTYTLTVTGVNGTLTKTVTVHVAGTTAVAATTSVPLLHEYLHLSRTITLDGSPHPPDPDPFWMGHSIGRWEGDTLVVDSIGFKESEINGYKTTEDLHVVERFRRPNLGTLEHEAVIEDPNVFAGPWLITRTFPLLPEFNRVDEFFCENNRDYKPLFGK
jgi:hypothetical protein